MNLYRSHRNLFWLILSTITTDFMIGIIGVFFGKHSNPSWPYFTGAFILLGLVGYYALFTNNRKLLIAKLSFGLAYDLYWAIILGIAPFITERARDYIWTFPLWMNLAVCHVVALIEPPKQQLTQKYGK